MAKGKSTGATSGPWKAAAESDLPLVGDPAQGLIGTTTSIATLATLSRQSGGLTCFLTLSGSASFECDGAVHFVRACSLLWSALRHPIVLLDASEDFRCWTGWYSDELVSRTLEPNSHALLALREVRSVSRLAGADVEMLATLFQRNYSSPDVVAFVAGMVRLLIASWGEVHSERVETWTDVHPAVEKAVHILRAQPETNSMRVLAKDCGASASWLSRLFREQLGISLVGFRNQSRIERFFQLYNSGAQPNLMKAAIAAGFGSYAQFHRVFKDTIGCSPAALKRGATALRPSRYVPG